MTDILEWKGVANTPETRKLKVDGGHIYMVVAWEMVSTVFVPDLIISLNEQSNAPIAPSGVTIDGVMHHVADLSMKINKMKSDLREFEKQRVEPLHYKINTIIEQVPDEISEHIKPLIERIEKLELVQNVQSDIVYKNLLLRIEKLEKHQDELYKMISRIQEVNIKQADYIDKLDHYFNDQILDKEHRLCKLESIAHSHSEENAWHDSKIEPLIKKECQHEWFDSSTVNEPSRPIKVCKKCDKTIHPVLYKGEECQHEWAGYLLASMPPQRQCKKCGHTEILTNY